MILCVQCSLVFVSDPNSLNNDFRQPRPSKPVRQPGPPVQNNHPVIPQRPVSQTQNFNNSNQQQNNASSMPPRQFAPGGGIQSRPTLRQPPPPPNEPAPPNQPRVPLGGFRLPMGQQANVPRFNNSNVSNVNNTSNTPRPVTNNNASNRQSTEKTPQQSMAEILKTPSAGVSGAKRSSLSKPTPGAGRPKPKPKPVSMFPKCRALYDYEAKDLDELSLKEGSVLEILKERKKIIIYKRVCNSLHVTIIYLYKYR